jgi:hypothetical protein
MYEIFLNPPKAFNHRIGLVPVCVHRDWRSLNTLHTHTPFPSTSGPRCPVRIPGLGLGLSRRRLDVVLFDSEKKSIYLYLDDKQVLTWFRTSSILSAR